MKARRDVISLFYGDWQEVKKSPAMLEAYWAVEKIQVKGGSLQT